MDISDVSVVICTKNNKDNIERVIKSVISNKPGEIIIVDGNSTDGTRDIIKRLGVKMVTDPGEGIAKARQIGLDESKLKYVFYSGDDNILQPDSIGRLKDYMLKHDWVGASMLTRLYGRKSWISFCANERLKARIREGETQVIGSPHLYEGEILRKLTFDEKCKYSDDTDLGERIKKVTNKKIGYSNVICYEIGKTSAKDIIARFKMYGQSDGQFWNKYSGGWGIKRKIKSLLHPITAELITPIVKVEPKYINLIVIPFFVWITIIRYTGWVKYSKEQKKKMCNLIRNKKVDFEHGDQRGQLIQLTHNKCGQVNILTSFKGTV